MRFGLTRALAIVEDWLRRSPSAEGHAQGWNCLGMFLGLTGAFASALDFRYL